MSSAEGDGLSSHQARTGQAETSARNFDIDSEQRYVSHVYGRLDSMRAMTAQRLADVLRDNATTHQGRSERDTAAAMQARSLAELDGVESGLCFGRLDFHNGQRTYNGVGINYNARLPRGVRAFGGFTIERSISNTGAAAVYNPNLSL